jgi:hypothetical protein
MQAVKKKERPARKQLSSRVTKELAEQLKKAKRQSAANLREAKRLHQYAHEIAQESHRLAEASRQKP